MDRSKFYCRRSAVGQWPDKLELGLKLLGSVSECSEPNTLTPLIFKMYSWTFESSWNKVVEGTFLYIFHVEISYNSHWFLLKLHLDIGLYFAFRVSDFLEFNCLNLSILSTSLNVFPLLFGTTNGTITLSKYSIFQWSTCCPNFVHKNLFYNQPKLVSSHCHSQTLKIFRYL